MSLRERVQNQNEAKAAEREKLEKLIAEITQAEAGVSAQSAEMERISSKEEDEAIQREKETALKSKFEGILSKRAALSRVLETFTQANEGVRKSKANLKSERNNLRAIHKESIDTDTGIASLPKPEELVRNEEYKDEEEIQAYSQAREEFKLSAAQVKKVRAGLKGIGIENSAEMSPEELRSAVQEQEKALDTEARTFILEHPDFDPEKTAEIKEEIIAARKNELLHKFNIIRSPQAGMAFHNQLQRADNANRERVRQGGRDGRILWSAAEAAVKTFDDPHNGDRRIYVETLRKTLPNLDSISDMDREAVDRAFAEEFVRKGWYETEDPKLLEKALEIEKPQDFRGKEFSEVDKHGAPKSLHQRLAERIQDLGSYGMVKTLTDKLLEVSKKMEEYNSIPEKVKAIRERRAAIDRRVNSHAYNEPSIPNETERLDSAANTKRTERDSVQGKIERLRKTPLDLNALSRLPVEILTAQIQAGPNGLTVEGVWKTEERRALTSKIKDNEAIVKNLSRTLKDIKTEKDGIWGPSKAKKQLIERLQANMSAYGLGKGDVTEAEAHVRKLETDITNDTSKLHGLERYDDEVERNIDVLKPYGSLFKEPFTGTLSEFLQEIRERSRAELTVQEAKQTKIQEEIFAIADKKDELDIERLTLRREDEDLANKLKDLRERSEKMGRELVSAGYLDQFQTRDRF